MDKLFKHTKHQFLSIFYLFIIKDHREQVGCYTGGHNASKSQTNR